MEPSTTKNETLITKSLSEGLRVAHDPYRCLLTSLAPKRVYICPYPGNAGDELIVRGTLSLLEQMGLERTMNGRVADLIIYPGGNPTMWREDIAVWRDAWHRFPSVPFVVGPATFQVFERHWIEELAQSGKSVRALVARDPVSYKVLQDEVALPHVKVLLAHDPAFYLRGSALVDSWLEGVREDHDLCSFRNDHEGGGVPMQAANFLGLRLPEGVVRRLRAVSRRGMSKRKLVSAMRLIDGTLPILVRDVSAMNFEMFLDAIMGSRSVHTDRLHVMICAALLGKKVYAYSTSYGKLEAVYEHSMREWSNVEFV